MKHFNAFSLLIICSILSGTLTAQSGILMNNGASITTTGTGWVSIFADSSSHRANVINFDASSSARVLATWPCTALGGIVYAGTVYQGYGTETCLGLGTQGKVLQVGGSSAPIWSPFKFPTSVGATNTPLASNGTDYVAGTVTGNTSEFATATGTFTGHTGEATTVDSNGNLQTSGIVPGKVETATVGGMWSPSWVWPTASGSDNAGTTTFRFFQFTALNEIKLNHATIRVNTSSGSANVLAAGIFDSGCSSLLGQAAMSTNVSSSASTAATSATITLQPGTVYMLVWVSTDGSTATVRHQGNVAWFGVANQNSSKRVGTTSCTTADNTCWTAASSTILKCGTLTADSSIPLPYIFWEP